jgi:hypothetical protein
MTAPADPSRTPGTQDGRAADRASSVNTPLTPNRTRLTVENPEYAAFARRILTAYARRVATGDIEALALMAELAGTIDASIRDAVTGLRDRGYSWAGDRLPARGHPPGRTTALGKPVAATPHGGNRRARGVPDRTVIGGESRSLTGTSLRP